MMIDEIEKEWKAMCLSRAQEEEAEKERQRKIDDLVSTAHKCFCGSKAVLYIGNSRGQGGSGGSKHYIECSNEVVQKPLHCSIKSKEFTEWDDTPIEKAIDNWNLLIEFYKGR